MILKELTKISFWKIVARISFFFFLVATVFMLLFYLVTLSFENFKQFVVSEKSIRRFVFIIAFAPVYGLLMTLFQKTIKRWQ